MVEAGSERDGLETSGRVRASWSCTGVTACTGSFSGSGRNVGSVAGWIKSPKFPADNRRDRDDLLQLSVGTGGDWDGSPELPADAATDGYSELPAETSGWDDSAKL